MKGAWRWTLAALVLATGLGYAVRFPWGETWRILASADWRLLALATGVNLVSLMCKGYGWHLLLRPVAPARVRSTQAATFAGAAVGSLGISLSGEAARVHVLNRRDGVEITTAAQTIAASRMVEAAALGVFLFLLAAITRERLGWRLPAGAVAVTVGALAALRWLPWLWPRRPDGTRARGYTQMQLPAPLAFAVASWALQWATYHFAILAAHARVTPRASALALLLANLGGILRLTPGNVGIVQGAIVVALAPAGVPAAQAVAGGLALQAVQVLPVLMIGMAVLGRRWRPALWSRRRSAALVSQEAPSMALGPIAPESGS